MPERPRNLVLIDRQPRDEISRFLAAAYLRLRQRAHNCQSQANLKPPDSPELSGYGVPPE